MIESVKIQQGIEQLEQAVEKEASEAQQPAEEDVARFEQAMGGEPVSMDPANPAFAGATAVQEPSAGDVILKSLDQLRTGHNEKLERINSSLETLTRNREMSPQDLLKVQWELFQTNFELEVTTKVVDKTDQGVSTLLRSQS